MQERGDGISNNYFLGSLSSRLSVTHTTLDLLIGLKNHLILIHLVRWNIREETVEVALM